MELTFVVAILVRKDILSVEEAHQLLKASREATLNANLGEMIAKVDKALTKKKQSIEKIDAKEFMNRK